MTIHFDADSRGGHLDRPGTAMIPNHDAVLLERFRAGGVVLDLETLDTPLARSLGKAMIRANGLGRDDALNGCLSELPTEIANSVRTALFAVDVDGRSPKSPVRDGSDQSKWPSPPGPSAYPGLVGQIVDEVTGHSEADPVGILTHLLAATSSVVGSGPHALVGATRHPVRENFVLVGRTAKSRKGDAWNPVKYLFDRFDRSWRETCVKSGLSTGEGLIFAVRDPIMKWDPKEQEEVEVDPGVEDKRLLALEPEFARMLRAISRPGSTLSPVIREAWDDGLLQIITRSAPIRATDAHVQVVGHITLDELRRELSDVEMVDGFANRFLFVCVRRTRLLPDPIPLEGQAVDELAMELGDTILWASGVERMRRDAVATELWRTIYEELSAEQPGIVGALLARAEAHVLRLSMIYALLDHSTDVREQHLQSAWELWKFVERSVIHIFGESLGDPQADKLAGALRQRGVMTRTEIRDLFGRHVSQERIDNALDLLGSSGVAVRSMRATGGRPVETWQFIQ